MNDNYKRGRVTFCGFVFCMSVYRLACKLPSCQAWLIVRCLVLRMFSCIKRTVCGLVEVQWGFYIYLALFLFIHVLVIWCSMSRKCRNSFFFFVKCKREHHNVICFWSQRTGQLNFFFHYLTLIEKHNLCKNKWFWLKVMYI